MNADAPKGFAERFIHSEIYKKYHGVQSVVHAHAEAVLPFSISSIPLRPVFHMAGVMGAYKQTQSHVFGLPPNGTCRPSPSVF